MKIKINRKIVVLLVILVTALLIIIVAKKVSNTGSSNSWPKNETELTESPSTTNNIPELSTDKKSIIANDSILLEINHDKIFDYFKTKGELCDDYYLNNPTRAAFCTDKNIFKQKTNFKAISVTKNNEAIGFSISSEELSPDAVVGIFYPNRINDPLHFLTNYYLGNQFLSFSPNGAYFVYKSNCWEALCGLTIKSSKTLQTKAAINQNENVDERREQATFIKWLGNNSVEYKLGDKIKIAEF